MFSPKHPPVDPSSRNARVVYLLIKTNRTRKLRMLLTTSCAGQTFVRQIGSSVMPSLYYLIVDFRTSHFNFTAFTSLSRPKIHIEHEESKLSCQWECPFLDTLSPNTESNGLSRWFVLLSSFWGPTISTTSTIPTTFFSNLHHQFFKAREFTNSVFEKSLNRASFYKTIYFFKRVRVHISKPGCLVPSQA